MENRIIKKSNEVVRSQKSCAISIESQRIFSLIITKIETIDEEGWILLTRREINTLSEDLRKKWTELNRYNEPAQIKKLFNELSAITLSGDGWMSVLCSSVRFSEDLEEVRFLLPPDVRVHVAELTEHYTQYYLDMALGLTGRMYTLPLYEFLRSRLFQGKDEKVYTVSAEELRGILGATEKSYQDFRRFNDRILKPSLKEINGSDVSDLTVFMTTDKKRPVKNLTFKIIQKKFFQGHLSIEETEVLPVRVTKICDNMGYDILGRNRNMLHSLIVKEGEEIVIEALEGCAKWKGKAPAAAMVNQNLPRHIQEIKDLREATERLEKAGLDAEMAQSVAIQQKEKSKEEEESSFQKWRASNTEVYKKWFSQIVEDTVERMGRGSESVATSTASITIRAKFKDGERGA